MFRAARLRERNRKRGHGMKTYTTAETGMKFVAGEPGKPSALRVVSNDREVAEISEIDQFEVLEFQTVEQLDSLLQREMEERSRLGHPAVRAEIISKEGEIPGATEEKPIKAKAPEPPRSLDEVAPNDKDRDLRKDYGDADGDDSRDEDEAQDEEEPGDEDEARGEEETSEKEEKPAKGPQKSKGLKGKKKTGRGRKVK